MTVSSDDRTGRPEADEDEFKSRVRPWWVPWLVALAVAGGVIGIGSYFVYGRDSRVASMSMGDDDDNHIVPAVMGFYEGQAIHFLHTEASDPQVAAMLSEMMGSPVIIVASLSDVAESALGDVFVFTNGVRPDDDAERGPFGFQADVFDTVPGDAAYSPLRAVRLVTWSGTADARVLASVEAIEQAEAAGDLQIERPGVVVNMPIVDWPGGTR